MGDRTTVTLTVLSSQLEAAKGILKKKAGEPWEKNEISQQPLKSLIFDEVNYGDLPGLKNLQAAGIAYDSEWGQGGEYSPGCTSCRFTKDGELIVKEIYDYEVNPPIETLLTLIDDHEALRSYILLYKEEHTVPLITPEQEDFGKVYRIKQLIAA